MSSPITGVANLEAYNTTKDLNKDIVFQATTGGTGSMFFFNFASKGPLSDVRVRKALTLLIDGNENVMATYGSTMFMDPDHGIMPPAYALPLADINKILGRDIPMDQRVTQAKKLMAEAGYATGFKTTYLYTTMPEGTRSAQMMADLWKRHLNVDLALSGKLAAEVNKARDEKNFEIIGQQPYSMLGEPNDLMPMFMSGTPQNFMSYKNAEADKLWTQQSTMLDMAARKKITQQIEQIILSDYVVIPQSFFRNVTALQPYVKGFVANEGAYCSNIAYEVVWLDK
jgi:ABC-type oligopeptide transport system substrate-binding subunit